MPGFRFDIFKGIRPRIAKRKLPDGEAQIAENVKLGSADLIAFKENSVITETDTPYSTVSIYLYDDFTNDLVYWFQWPNYVDVVPGPTRGDNLNRVYFTGDGTPKMTYNTLQTTPPFPTIAYELGVPRPLSRLEAVGSELPEDVAAANRRTSSAPGSRPLTTSFEIVNVDFTVYPGTGTPNDTWRSLATVAIVFDAAIGDTFKVLTVIDEDTVTLGSATGTGAVAATFANDTSSGNYYQSMDEQGSTQTADFVGWRIPDGLQVTITGHKLRAGDIIRVTRLDQSYGFSFNWASTADLFELADDGTPGDWGVPGLETDGTYRHENVRLGASADGETTMEVVGGFYYDVDRTSSDSDVLEDRTYVYTFVTSIGEEGPPSEPSSVVQALDGDNITLTGFETAPAGNRNITSIRLYRTNATSVGVEYQFVREVTIDQINADSGEVVDNIPATGLGEIILSTTWFPPPENMQGIVSMPNGMMVGFEGKDIFFSEPYQPHAWPPEYDQAVDFEIVALAPFGNSVAVLTTGNPYVITGSHPRNTNIRPYKINQACLNKESVALARDRVYYASPDGLVEIGVNGARITTEAWARKEDWQLYEPDTMIGEFHDGQYYGFWGADDTVTPQPAGSVAATGTLLTDVQTFERDIVAGGKTIILTLTNDTWVAAGDTFDAVRSDIINAITSINNEPAGWNVKKADIAATSVVRTSNTVVTITLPALAGYAIDQSELLSFKAPAVAITGSYTLTAPEQMAILFDSIYASEVVITTTASTSAPDQDLPEVLISDENIEVWTRQNAPGSIETTDAVDITDAAYHKTLSRWCFTGYNTAGDDTNKTIIYTNDALVDDAGWVPRTAPIAGETRPARAIIYDDTSDALFIGGDDNLLIFSLDGINWSTGHLAASMTGMNIAGFARAPQGGDGTEPYLYAICSDTKNVGRSANLLTAPLETVWTDLGTATTTGTALSAIASGDGLVFVANNHTAAEIGFYAQGKDSYTKIGDFAAGVDVSDMAYGNGRLVIITANGRIQYADAPDITTFGTWSTISGAIDGGGTRDLARIEYDEGSSTRIGYGFIATLSASGAEGDYVVYTSPDAVTWTLRQTVSNTSDATNVATSNPETSLESATGAIVSLTGTNIQQWARLRYPLVSLQIRADGTVWWRRDDSATKQIFPETDWVVPNWFNDPLYEVRVTDVVPLEGVSDFTASPGTNGNWFALSTDRVWSVRGGVIRFKVEIRYNGGAVLDSATYTLGSKNYTHWRDEAYDDFDGKYWYSFQRDDDGAY
jgi:hypothetical protein